jgi:D-alanyl-D-alanine carboxypeptidase (penicillin-binding protein 5/6)
MKVPPASTTKVMTALLVLENLALDQYVTVSHKATLPQPTKLYLKPGDKYRVRDLLYAILLKSANDAAVVLAEAVAGSEEEFVKMMNRRARALGAKHTQFANPHGLPSKATQFTTPYDMYLIFRHTLLNHSFFKKAVTLSNKTIYSKSGRQHSLRSHNKILFKSWKQKLFGKTGYTHAAGACFVGFTLKQGNILIIAIFGAPRRWEDIKYIVEKYGNIDL